jgi:hypothetical protein
LSLDEHLFPDALSAAVCRSAAVADVTCINSSKKDFALADSILSEAHLNLQDEARGTSSGSPVSDSWNVTPATSEMNLIKAGYCIKQGGVVSTL